MSKQDIEKRLGFAAQGAKAKFGLSPSEMKENQRRIETNIRYEAGEMRNLSSNIRFIKDEIERLTAEIKNTRDIKRKAQLSLKLDAENKKMKDQVAYLRRARQMIQENQADAKSLGITLDPKWSGNFSRPGAKAEMGFLSRVGYAATALTADPADPKSPEYRKQVSEAKAAAKDAITNYKFMRDKVKERLAALDAYVTNAIKVINSATSAKDIEHYVEQLRIAVKSQSMILGASKSPFSRAGVKVAFAATPAELKSWAQVLKKSIQASKKAEQQSAANSDEKYDYGVWKHGTMRLLSAVESGNRSQAKKELNDLQRSGFDVTNTQDIPAALRAWVSSTTASRPGVKKASTDFDLGEACWEGYEAVGTKKKDGKTVPNCVPKKKAARPGVKAKFADAALNQIRNNAAISDKILTLVSKGLSVPQAIDSVLGEGTYKRIGSEVYDELKKAKASRPGVKAKA